MKLRAGKAAAVVAATLPFILSYPVAAQTVAASASAGASSSAGAEASGDDELETIIVTAQKVGTGLQKTPIAITTISPEQMDRANIRSVLDLDKQVPGLTITDGGAFPLNVTIRGVGYDGLQNNSAQPGVAFVENGVYIASPVALTSSFVDLKQMEVLRGPQGTVNGQNADGGALNLTTGLAQLGRYSSDAEVSYGSYDYNRERATVNVPVSNTLAMRVAFQHEGHDGWMDAPNLGTSVGDEATYMGRASLLWAPTDRLAVSLWGEVFNSDTNGLGVKNMFDPIEGARVTSNDYPTPQTVRSRVAAGTISYDFDFATLKSTTSYQYVYYNAHTSTDLLDRADALAIYGVKDYMPYSERESTSETEEINLASTPGGPLDWIVGMFYLHTSGRERVFEVQQSNPVGQAPTPFTVDFTPASNAAAYGAAFSAYGLAFDSIDFSDRNSLAGYGQGTYHLLDNLRLTGGLRYSWDSYSADTSANGVTKNLTSEFTELTGKASIEYDVVPNSTWYVSFSTGVKPGGTNLNPSSTVVPSSFEHEFVRAYEVGTKNELFDRTLRLNISAFYNDYRNLQSDSEDPIPFQGGITNIPKSHTYGVEGEASVILPEGFRLDGNAAVMQSRVDSHFAVLDPYVAQQVNRADGGVFVGSDIADRAAAYQDLHGHQLGRVPHFSGMIGLNKSTDFGDYGKLDSYIQANYRTPYWARVFNNAVDRVPSQFTMNLNLHYQPASGPWYAEFQVTNLTGSDDIASRYAENFGVGGVFDQLVPPRQFIGRIGAQF